MFSCDTLVGYNQREKNLVGKEEILRFKKKGEPISDRIVLFNSAE